jgi:hypothetical protein
MRWGFLERRSRYERLVLKKLIGRGTYRTSMAGEGAGHEDLRVTCTAGSNSAWTLYTKSKGSSRHQDCFIAVVSSKYTSRSYVTVFEDTSTKAPAILSDK